MGIEKFFSTVNRNFNVTTSIDLTNTTSQDLIHAKYLLIDFNSIIHNTSSKLISELNQTRSNSKHSNIRLEDIDIMIIKEVNNFLITMFEQLDLSILEHIYVALDGVPTFAKILEQKKRRFIGDFVEKLLEKYSLPFNWSKNNISPGTIFMDKINKYLLNIKYITKNRLISKDDLILKSKDYEFFTKIKKFSFSDTNSEGEGEMKIYDIINQLDIKHKDTVLFYSPDSDVILLSMISKYSENIKVIRFNNDTLDLSLIDIKLLKQVIYDYCLEKIEGSRFEELNQKKLIRDIVFIFTVFGNDFLPKCESIQTNLDFLFLIDMYLINLINHGYMISENDVVSIVFFNYLNLMRTHEKRLLFRNSYQNVYQNYNYANQKNFLIDLLKLKNLENIDNFVTKKFGDPFYNFYNNILFYIDPIKIKELLIKNKNPKEKQFGCLNFYFIERNKMIEIIKKSLESVFAINDLFTIDINNVSADSDYEHLRYIQFQSKIKKHIMNMKDLSPRDTELYLINNKLDKYYTLFNPINEFYGNILKTRTINETYYYQKYFNNHDRKNVVTSYLNGFKWIFQYYFNRNKSVVDETWYYPYFKAPLFETIVSNYNQATFEHNIKGKKLDIDPLAQLLYITPIRLSDLSKPDFYKLFAEFKSNKFVNEDFVKKIKGFIEKHPQFFYNLDELYHTINTGSLKKNLFDCSHSSFVSKCHYEILNYVVDINQFVTKLKQIRYP